MNTGEIAKLYDFSGKTIFVTGGTGVLCSAIARGLSGCGASVALLARNAKKGEAVAATMPNPANTMVVDGDVLSKASVQRAADEVVSRFGRIDGLVNGAGGNNPQATTRPDLTFFDLPEAGMRDVLDLNLLGTIFPSQVVSRIMAAQGTGVILNVSSASAIRPLTRVITYSAAKAGIDNFTRWLAVYLARDYSPQLRVNAIAPGFFVTEQNRNLVIDLNTGKPTPRGESILAHTPMGRFGLPEDLVGTALWLLSPASAFVTGIVVPLDGGFSAFTGV
jgi:NAD(P)-dependent dehydrogenase (short-subunit alcohol dehydrogenase family)